MGLKTADYYGNLAALAAKCPPGSSQSKFYTDIADMVLTMLKDVVVDPKGVTPMTAPAGGGPIEGKGKLT